MKDALLEDLLERLWWAHEQGGRLGPQAPELQRLENLDAHIEEARRQGLLSSGPDGFELSVEGERRARRIVRRHRLAEELFSVVLELEGRELFKVACGFEHVLNPRVTESICTLLGHPTVCPHGKRIPPGECCERAETQITPLVERLTELPPGSDARVVFMTPHHRKRMERLMALGLVPGAVVRLQQKRPAPVVRVGETTLAVDEEILAEIHVRRITSESA